MENQNLYTIDGGNSFLKIATHKNSKMIRVDKVKSINDFIFEEYSYAITSNVAQSFSLPKSLTLIKNDSVELISNYDKSSLGEDRRVTSVYLQNTRHQNVVIIDAGSFITIDEISNGVHLGGPIFLGLGNFAKSYQDYSNSLPIVTQENKDKSDTHRAIYQAHLEYIETIKNSLNKFPNHKIIVTGGDANLFSEIGEVRENLIHEALYWLATQQSYL